MARRIFDSGTGQDARLEFRPQATGSHWIEIVSFGGFWGTYVVAAELVDDTASCGTPAVTETGGPSDPNLLVDAPATAAGEGGFGTATFTVKLATAADGRR